MQGHRFAVLACVSFFGLAAHASSQPVTPPPFEVLRSFDRPPVRPLAGLAESEGALYGASKGGHFGRGALFRLVLPSTDPNARVEKVYSWSDVDHAAGRGPALGTPLVASDGHLYGVAGRGPGSTGGGIYRLSAAGELAELSRLDAAQDGFPVDVLVSYAPGALVESGDWLYGTLYSGGPNGRGTVFRVHRTDRTFDRLHAFTGTDGEFPMAGLVERDGWFYGTTSRGGEHGGGTLFRIAPAGGLEILHHFTSSEGMSPAAELVVGPDRHLYGALGGGGPLGCGSVFRFDPGAPGLGAQLLASFACRGTQGSYPEGGMVVLDTSGTPALFGVTPAWSSLDVGTIYRITLDETLAFTVLETLPGGDSCSSRLLYASDGQIYGQCYGRHDSSNEGRVFRIDPASGNVSTVFRFGVDEGGGHTPYALVQGPGAAIYGTTRRGGPANRGTLFRLSPAGDFEVVHAFTDSTSWHEIADPSSGDPPLYAATFLTHAADGLLYGARCDGGANGTGSLFRLDPAAPGSFETLYSADPYAYYDQTACPHGPLVESALSPGTFFGTAMGAETFLGGAFRFDSDTNEVSPLWTSGEGQMPLFTEPVGRVALGPDDRVYAAYTTSWTQSSGHFNGGVVEALPGGGIVAKLPLYPASGPIGGLVHGPSTADGGFVLYGSSTRGGIHGRGSLYEVSVPVPGGPFALALVHSFGGTDGANPTAELTLGPDGVYYGSTARGGAYGYGTLFAMDAAGQVTTLHHFDEVGGAYPETQLVAGPDGNLYGAASSGGPGGGGVLFRVNLAPRVELEGPASALEGETLTFTAIGGDAQGDTLTLWWELDEDGLFDDSQGETVSLAAPDGDGEFTVSVRATDPTGLVAEDSIKVAVANVAPAATFAAAPRTVMPGEPFTLSFVDPSDPSADDVAAGFLYDYDCNGDGSYDVLESRAPTHSCIYEPAGTYVARGRIEDKDGGHTEYTALVVPPPLEGIDLLIDEVNDLVADGALSPDAARHLLQELDQARKHVDEGQPGPTVNQLRHFIRTVEDLVSSGDLDAAAGQQLIDAANQIIAQLGG